MEFPGRQFREHGGPAGFPDLMNDPAYDTNRRGKEREQEEPDTCRICRGEATEQDQLYYPCKCSGSIKFVHQPCLVQWLAHSQKKHCELCKTPFHFTKLYDPDMPENLPILLFTKQLLIHSLRTVVTWLRWVLVAFVWLGWLPWSMRAIWRALFWLADGRWSAGDGIQKGLSLGNAAHLGVNHTLVAHNTDPATSSVGSAVPPSATEGPAPSIFGFPAGEPLLLSLTKKAFATLFFPAMSSGFGSTDPSNVTTTSNKPRRPSWLSDVKFLNSLTPSPTINNILIDTLEGQLITLLVVVSFILIFLIREWVVQQQPMDNIAEGEREAAVQLIANNRPAQPAEAAPRPEPQPPALPDDNLNAFRNREALPPVGRHLGQVAHHADQDDIHQPATELEDSRGRGVMNLDEPFSLRDLPADNPSTAPFARNNDAFNLNLSAWQQSPQANQPWPAMDMQIFRDLWHRAHGDLEEIIRIVREEGREEELSWLVRAVTKLLQNDDLRRSRNREPDSPDLSALNSRVDVNIPRETIPGFVGASGSSAQQRTGGTNPFESMAPHWGSDVPSSSRFASDSDFQARHELDLAFQAAERDDPDLREVLQDFVFGEEIGDDHGSASAPSVSENIITTDAESVEDTQSSLQPSHSAAVEPPKSLARRAFDWFWADIIPEDPNAERQQDEQANLVDEPVLEAALPHAQNDGELDGDLVPDNQAALADFGVDANDLDAIEEADDLEGILELIGMQGPIFGLLQNGVFCALLISFTVAAGIWLPYLGGKIALVLLANPIQFIFGVPMTAVSVLADVVLDTLIGSLGYILYWTSLICRVILSPFGAFVPMGEWTKSITNTSLSLIDASSHRLGGVVNTFFVFHEADVPMFSVISHHALKIHQGRIASLFRSIFLLGKFLIHDLPLNMRSSHIPQILSLSTLDVGSICTGVQERALGFAHNLPSFSNFTNWVTPGMTSLALGPESIDYDIAVWNTKDRTIAILMGYLLVSVVGLAYLRIARFISGVDRGQRVEGMVAEGLHQAGGVMKVILIIGIEMIVFPLYCGSLLDIALLPLFENATIASRVEFTSTYPLTSLFVHWFIGTCYMFHFALFVSMCRKIMRNGVLYFIRDPDDPTFHPVRDVLERNITTQLRKIAFSALVYGALVIICLGGVVWGLYYGFNGVLPLHWSSKDPVLEFPIDLLFYNFGIPLAIRAFKPSEGLHNLYNWWFRKCARFLRLSDFFFSERHLDEEGSYGRQFWSGYLPGNKEDIRHLVTGHDQQADADEKQPDRHFKRDGRFVRAPASDQVRIPKGSQVFLEVTEANERVDGAPDNDQGHQGRLNEMFIQVYIPPFFRTRIAAFLVLIWLFAAATGVGTTVLPLVIGRKAMHLYFASRPVNDIYAFSVGMGLFCAAACIVLSCRACFRIVKDRFDPFLRSPQEACLGLMSLVASGMGLIYVFASFSIILPSIFGLVMELYLLVPIYTYLGNSKAHAIYLVQDWALGVLYVQMAVKLALWHSRSRPAAVLNGIFRDGWLKPNVRLATRALLLPILLLATIAIVLPPSFGFVLNSIMFGSNPELQTKVYRYTYPATLLLSLMAWLAYLAGCQVEIWKVSIRDEFYLIGERLHNFREKRAREVGVPRRVITG
ncbi:hypothetical protein P175DRAFT_0559384 [Aspergillus ochraceoroseus IBT 24754]|uniref:RING-type E3 ubiquitin transferase n=1 Tax=Aspergillus ochraceoroseus IBT 24754 TaxID=1392256 RepID=A0A2T5LQK5_9EURO|nr:uncharacterized protein P175DRAFT_0559384 [Aspergillus ochraceoroseus IBT 24754]PTU18565.1 hypothetical protein P175DRAFT_0559384 [Aspergillus ochraceoroseus IBT 24754]